MMLLESICSGPWATGWKDPFGYYWGHEELWDLAYANHSYFRIRHLDTGEVVTNITSSISFGFGTAMVDHSTGTLWVFGTPNDRSGGTKKPPPDGPPDSERHGVWAWSSNDLTTWQRYQTDVQWNGPNVNVAMVVPGKHALPSNLPPHKYVMATEAGHTWAVNNAADGNLSRGWITLPASKAKGGVLACPSVIYVPEDGYYYTISGGNHIPLQRSKDLLQWTAASEMFIRASEGDVRTASDMMSSAHDNLLRGHAYNQSIPNWSKWDKDSNDADWCCQPNVEGMTTSTIIWGADGQGSSGWKAGPEGVASIGVGNMTLAALVQAYF